MKNYLLGILLFCIFSSTASSQSQFVIGAEWLNPGDQNPTYELTDTDWGNIHDLGLNWGMIGYSDATKISNALTKASTYGVQLFVAHGQLATPAQGQRWQYHQNIHRIIPLQI